MAQFNGFSQGALDFLWGIRFNNEKVWFAAHKGEYLTLVAAPMKTLAEQVMAEIAARCPEKQLTVHVSRIYRDARRTHGKGPFKDHLWFSLSAPVEDRTDTPVFYFELSPDGYGYGMGYYAAAPLTMAKFRRRLEQAPKLFEPMVRQFAAQSEFFLDGDKYARPKGDPSSLLADWYERKSISLCCERTADELLFSRALADTVVQGFLRLMPYFDYFSTLVADPDPRGEI